MAYEVRMCEFSEQGRPCIFAAKFLVMTQMPPYTQAHTCYKHLALFADRLLGGWPSVAVLVRRVSVWGDQAAGQEEAGDSDGRESRS